MPVAPQGLATFPGVNQIVSATMTLSEGITPSCCTMDIAPQTNFAASLGTLTWTFDNVIFQFYECRVDKQSVRMSSQGQVVSLQIYDRRWKWVYPTISGYYNQVTNQGTPSQTILPSSQRKSAQDLAVLILTSMGEMGYDISQVPNDIYPPADWDYTNAAKALADLAEQCGCRVVLKQNNTVQLAKVGFGADLPSGSVMEFNGGVTGFVVPDAIQLVLGKTKFQYDLNLMAVGLDTDGSIKPIDDLSYKPNRSDGWASINPSGFTELSPNSAPGNPIVPNVTVQPNSPRACALKSIWRWYALTDNPYTIPGYKAIRTVKQMLPLDSVLCETTTIGGTQVPKPAVVYGLFARKDGVFGNYTVPTVYTRPFTINGDKGIVEFGEPVYQWNGGGTSFSRKRPQLALRTSFNLRDNDSGGWIRMIQTLNVPGATGTIGIRSIVHDELQAMYWGLFDDNGNYGGSANNLNADLANEINYDMSAALAEYEVKFPIEAVYAGLLPIDLDGAVQQVTWTVGTSGATTRASRNSEHSLIVPSYRQRRFNEQQRLQDFRERQTAIANSIRAAASPIFFVP